MFGGVTLAIVVFAFYCAPASAQVAVSGRVVDETGAAISGARIVLRPSQPPGAKPETAAENGPRR